jgi:hypothetical protein
MTVTRFSEHEIKLDPPIAGSGYGWNRDGMHQADVHPDGRGGWIACVDGLTSQTVFGWKY